MKKVIPIAILFCIMITFMEAQVDTAWVRRYNGDANQEDQPYRETILAIDEIGNVYVTGITDKDPNPGNSNYDYLTVKYGPSGDVKWIRSYHGSADGHDIATAIAVDNDWNVYVTGISYDSITGDDFLTIKYDSTGAEQWTTRFDLGNESDHPYCLAVDDSGNVYVGGSGTHMPGGWDYLVVKYNADGDTIWTRTYNGSGDDEDYGTAMAIDDLGNVYITGRSHQSGTVGCNDYVTIKYNSTGTEQWVARYNGPYSSTDQAWGIAVDDLGNVIVTGASSTGYTWNSATVKYNSLGTQQWAKIYDAPGNSWDNGYGIAVDHNGFVYVTGNVDPDTSGGIQCDYLTIKYDPVGDTVWVRWYNGTANNNDEAHAIALDTSGNVYVTGYSIGAGTGRDFVTIKYNSSGSEQWVARYDGPANGWDEAWALKVGGNNIYVAGYSAGLGTMLDYATIKYNQMTGIQEGFKNKENTGTALQVFPTVVSNTTRIAFFLPQKTKGGRISIFDVNGRKIKEFVLNESRGSVIWKGSDENGKDVSAGVYFIRLDTPDFKEVKKIQLIR